MLKRLLHGMPTETRARAGRLSFQCKYPDGRGLIEKGIAMIEADFASALAEGQLPSFGDSAT